MVISVSEGGGDSGCRSGREGSEMEVRPAEMFVLEEELELVVMKTLRPSRWGEY